MIDIQKTFIFPDDETFLLENDQYSTKWVIPNNLAYFQGHFPNNPVLPAVALIDLITHIISKIEVSQTIRIKSIPSAKFSEIFIPGDTISIKIEKRESKKWYTSLSKDGGNKNSKIIIEIS